MRLSEISGDVGDDVARALHVMQVDDADRVSVGVQDRVGPLDEGRGHARPGEDLVVAAAGRGSDLDAEPLDLGIDSRPKVRILG